MNKKAILLVVLGFAAFVGFVFYRLTAVAQVSCEVCITYRGRSECRQGAGATEEEAQRTATDVACALLAAGMTDSIACTSTTPTRLMCTAR